MKLYEIKVNNYKGEEVGLDNYKGKVLLIVNTALGCGFAPQYKGLEELYRKYKDQGFEILDFPCNQFANQAPETNEETQTICHMKYDTTFQTFAKIEVNGKNEHPLYHFLKSNSKGVLGNNIKWNFTKFLVDREGNVIERFSPTTEPQKIETKIIELLEKK